MPKDMYQKEKKEKAMSKNDTQEGLQKNVINWDISTDVKLLENHY